VTDYQGLKKLRSETFNKAKKQESSNYDRSFSAPRAATFI